MEFKIQDLLKQALHEENELTRLSFFIKACKQITTQLPFPQFINVLNKQQDVLRYLFIAQPIFTTSIDLIIDAITDKYQKNLQFVKYFFKAAQYVACLKSKREQDLDFSLQGSPTTKSKYCREVYKNFPEIKIVLLSKTKSFAISLKKQFQVEQVGASILQFYKIFIQNNHQNDLLNCCFVDAMQIRKGWQDLIEWDTGFQREVEQILIHKKFDADGLKNHSIIQIDTDLKEVQRLDTCMQLQLTDEQNYQQLSSQDKLIKSIEDWLFQKNDYPIISYSTHGQTLHADFFKNQIYMEILLSFLLNPIKYRQVTEFKIHANQGENILYDHAPLFRRKWVKKEDISYMEVEQRRIIQYRAFRTMIALTNIKNHFLITQANPEYFSQAFSFIYENLRLSSSSFILNCNSLTQYLQFLLYYETDISVYFFLYYNLPYRLMLYAEYPAVSQLLIQLFLFQNGSKNYYIDNQQTQMVWKYLEFTEFFQDLMKMTLGDDGEQTAELIQHSKAMISYKPKTILNELHKPDLTPHQRQQQVLPLDNKILIEEEDKHIPDYDKIRPYFKKRSLKLTKIFQRMIEFSPNIPRRVDKKSGTVKIQQAYMQLPIKVDSPYLRSQEPDEVFRPPLQKEPRDYTILYNMRTKSQSNIFALLNHLIQQQLYQPEQIIVHRRSSIEENQWRYQQKQLTFGTNIIVTQSSGNSIDTSKQKNHTRQSESQISQTRISISKPENYFKINHANRLQSLHIIDTNFKNLIMSRQPQQAAQFSIEKKRTAQRRPSIKINSKTSRAISGMIINKETTTSSFHNSKTTIILEQPSLLRRFDNLLADKRPQTSGLRFRQSEEFCKIRERNLYPQALRDFNITKLEMQGHKPEFEAIVLEKNEEYSRELIGLIYQIVEDILQKRGKSRWELEQRRMKWQILISNKLPDFLNWLAQNYFLKLKIQDEENIPTSLLSGKVYNKILSNGQNVILNLQIKDIDGILYQHFLLLAQLITSDYVVEAWDNKPLYIQNLEIFNHINIRSLTLIETLTLIIETTSQPNRFVNNISTSLWHLLLIYLTEYKTNEIYIQLVDRIMQTAILHGNSFVFHKILLRLNCFDYFIQILDEINCCEEKYEWADLIPTLIKKIFNLIYCTFKFLRKFEFEQLRHQISELSTFQKLKKIYENDLKILEQNEFLSLRRQLTQNNQKVFTKLFLLYKNPPSSPKKK